MSPYEEHFMWGFLKAKQNREIIGWIAGGVAAVAAGSWAVYTHTWDAARVAKADCKVEANASIAGCGDINTSGSVIINSGSPVAQKPSGD
jgi:hypothetical protein